MSFYTYQPTFQTNNSLSMIMEKRFSDQTITLQAKGRGNPWINLQDGTDQIFTYSGDSIAKQIIGNSEAIPQAMASADFDEDGVPDLVAGYASSSGGILTFHRGNIDSIFPNAPEAKQRQFEGTFVDAPFLPEANAFVLPESADYLGAGDFDADGHWDVVTTKQGSSLLYLLRGDGRGGFDAPKQIVLDGVVTSLATGEINRADGLTDVVVGIVAPDGAKLLVFEGPEGAMSSEPERFSLPAEARALSIGQLDDEYTMDVAVGAGSELLIIHGRDRKLSLDESERNKVPPAVINQYSFESTITSTALGDFTGKRRKEIAMLLSNGEVKVVSLKKGKSKQLKQSNLLLPDAWRESSSMIRAKVSSLPQDDLVLIDKANHKLHILGGEKEKESTDRVAISLDIDNESIAVLPMRLNVDALQDLVVLKKGQNNLTVAMTAPMSIFVVNSNGDESDCNVNDGVCSLGTVVQGQCVLTNVCTLRAAIQQANAIAGLDSISFAIGSGTQTITPLSGLPTISSSVIIDGTTQSGFTGVPIIELNGSSAGVSNGILLAGNSMIRGLVINRFQRNSSGGGNGIVLQTNGVNIIEGNYIGTNVNGTVDLGNSSSGIDILVNNNTIGGTVVSARNIISGNELGIQFNGSGTDNLVQGNFIGTDVSGTVALGSAAGVLVYVSNNNIGGTGNSARNIISGNGDGIAIGGNGNVVQGNYIGTDLNGSTDLGNRLSGVEIFGGGRDNTIGGTSNGARNIISGNDNFGVLINGSASTNNILQGSYIGTDVTGGIDLGNSFDGVNIKGGASNNSIGGTASGTRNVISGNNNNGVQINGNTSTNNQILGNFIGTDATGTIDLGNTLFGVNIQPANNTIGGTSPGARNIISGNDSSGIILNGLNATGNQILGNYIGTDMTGTADLGNTLHGVWLNSAANNTIGSSSSGAGNVVSGNNGNGIQIVNNTATNNQILGNFIGTTADGLGALGNNGHGVFITNSASNNTIGGVPSNAENIIQNNGGDGVYVDSGTGNGIVGNSIFGNSGLGIDLGVNGVTPNDTGDGDTGANNLQNFPVLTAVYSSGSSTAIQGTLNSSPNTAFTLHFYSNSQCDASGNGEGQAFLGSSTVTTNGSGNAFLTNITLPRGVAPGQFVTATATDPNNNTSEFSQCKVVVLRYKLTIRFQGPGAGQVTSLSGINCNSNMPSPCDTFFDAGAIVNLEARALDAESLFSNWMQDCTGSLPTCQLTMNQDKQVTAFFSRISFEDRSSLSQAYVNAIMSLKWNQIIRTASPSFDWQELYKNDKTNLHSKSLIPKVENVKIELSRNGGATFETIFAITPNDGSECWQVTGPTTTQALIRISSTDNPSINGISAHPFEIISSPGSGAITPGPGNCGGLTTGDGRSPIRGNSFYADRYTFSGTTGQQIAVSLESADFDTYLYLINPGNSVIAEDNNGGGGTNSRIPSGSSFFTLPSSGTYTIEATSFLANATGNYTLTLSEPCPYSLSTTSQNFPFTGGSGSSNVAAANICDWTAVSNVGWITVTSGSNNSGNGTVNFSVAANTSSFNRIGTINVNGQILTITQLSQNPTSMHSPFDFDGDGKTDISIFRPSNGQWWIQQSTDNVTKAFTFGTSADKPVPADYDGDGKTDVAFWRPSTGEWFVLRSSNLTFFAAPFGISTDKPAPSDFDGDGKADFAVFRPSSAIWFINKSSGGVQTTPFGTNGDIPVVADYDGDGKADLAIYRPNGGSGNGEWWILRSSNSSVFATPFGSATDKPVPADYTGDGKADVAFWRPSTGEWFVLRSEDLTFYAAPFGINGDIPVAGDYDGDGKADLAVFRPSSATWFVLKSTGGTLIQGFGVTGDIPVPSAFVP